MYLRKCEAGNRELELHHRCRALIQIRAHGNEILSNLFPSLYRVRFGGWFTSETWPWDILKYILCYVDVSETKTGGQSA